MNKSVLIPISVESTVSASKVGKTIGGALSLSKPNVKLLPPGLKPLANVKYTIVLSVKSYSPVTLVVTSSVVPSATKVSVLRKFVTSVPKVSSEYLNPDTSLKVSLKL